MRVWLWLGARLVVALVIIGWGISYLMPSGGDNEFKRASEAIKQVKSVRYTMVADPQPTQHNEGQGEFSCTQNVFHNVVHLVLNDPDHPFDQTTDNLDVGSVEYARQPDGSWKQKGYPYRAPQLTCRYLAGGDDVSFLPAINEMLKRGVIQKGGKKTVSGVRCREWLVTMRGVGTGFQHYTVCLGVDDHLPYEMTGDFSKEHWTYSGYNAPLDIELPPAPEVQTTSTN